MRDDSERLAHEIYFIPYSREVYERAFDREPKNSLEKAVLFYIKLNMGHGFRTSGKKVGWKLDVQGREKAYAAADWCKATERIMEAAERLRGVQIEHRPALDLIRRFNAGNVLIYCDPPYVLSTRSGKQYRKEMTDGDHMELLEALRQHRGPQSSADMIRPCMTVFFRTGTGKNMRTTPRAAAGVQRYMEQSAAGREPDETKYLI